MGALRWQAGKLFSGGKDGIMNIINTQTCQVENSFDFGGVLLRAIDVMGDSALVGLRDGTIYRVELGSGRKQVVMESHSDGEVWGLSIADDKTVLTTGDDNKIKAWNVSKR